jgi:hypothetical protein
MTLLLQTAAVCVLSRLPCLLLLLLLLLLLQTSAALAWQTLH